MSGRANHRGDSTVCTRQGDRAKNPLREREEAFEILETRMTRIHTNSIPTERADRTHHFVQIREIRSEMQFRPAVQIHTPAPLCKYGFGIVDTRSISPSLAPRGGLRFVSSS